MKSKKKTVLTIIISLVLIFIVFAVWYCGFSGGSAPRKYKELFDKVFDKGYTITKTDTEFEKGSFEKGDMQAPYIRRDYILEYTDKFDNKRQTYMPDYSRSVALSDKKMKYSDFSSWNDLGILSVIDDAETEIANKEMCDILIENFKIEQIPDEMYHSFVFHEKGYRMWLFTFDREPRIIDYQLVKNTRERLAYDLDPENRTPLSKFGLKEYANKKTSDVRVVITIEDEETLENLGELTEELEKTMNDYAALSEHGGNYKSLITYEYQTDEIDHYDEHNKPVYKTKNEILYSKYVIFGEDVTDICKGDNTVYSDLLIKKIDMDRIPYGE